MPQHYGYPEIKPRHSRGPSLSSQIAGAGGMAMGAAGSLGRQAMRGVGVNPQLPSTVSPRYIAPAQGGRNMIGPNSVRSIPSVKPGPPLSSMPVPLSPRGTNLGFPPVGTLPPTSPGHFGVLPPTTSEMATAAGMRGVGVNPQLPSTVSPRFITPAQGGRNRIGPNSVHSIPSVKPGPPLSSMPVPLSPRGTNLGFPPVGTLPPTSPGHFGVRPPTTSEMATPAGMQALQGFVGAYNATQDVASRGLGKLGSAAEYLKRQNVENFNTAKDAYKSAAGLVPDERTIQRVQPGIPTYGGSEMPSPRDPNYLDIQKSDENAALGRSRGARPRLPMPGAMTPTGPSDPNDPFNRWNVLGPSGVSLGEMTPEQYAAGHQAPQAATQQAPQAATQQAPQAATQQAPQAATVGTSILSPEWQKLDEDGAAGVLPYQVEAAEKAAEKAAAYERATAATPQRPGVDEDHLDRLNRGPNFRSRGVSSDRFDGAAFDRMRESDAASDAAHVMPTVGLSMNRNYDAMLASGMDPESIEAMRAGDQRRRERRGAPEPGSLEGDAAFRAHQSRDDDRKEENRRVRQHRATIGGGHAGGVSIGARTGQALQMVDREDRRARGDLVQDRQFGEDQRQFDENAAMANARQRQQNRQQMRGHDIDESRVSQDAINEQNRAAESGQARKDAKKQQKFDNKQTKKEAKRLDKDLGKTDDIEDLELRAELEAAEVADAGVSQSYISSGRHSEKSVMEMNSLLSGDLPDEKKKKYLSKYYGINNQKDLNVYLRASNYEEDHAFSLFGSEDGTQGTAFNPLNWLNWYQSDEVDATRDNIQDRAPF